LKPCRLRGRGSRSSAIWLHWACVTLLGKSRWGS